MDPREATRGVLAAHFDPTAARFIKALARLFPDAAPAAVAEAYLFVVGALVMTMAAGDRLARLAGPKSTGAAVGGVQDTEALVERLTTFCCAGAEAVLARDP